MRQQKIRPFFFCLVRKQFQPLSEKEAGIVLIDERMHLHTDKFGCCIKFSGFNEVLKTLFWVSMIDEPFSGILIDLGVIAGRQEFFHLLSQKCLKHTMISIPDTFPIKRNHEQVLLLQIFDESGAVYFLLHSSQKRVTERCAEPVKQRRKNQKTFDLGRLPDKHLLHHKINHMPINYFDLVSF